MPIKKSVNVKTNHKRFNQRMTWEEFVNILNQDNALFLKIKDFEIHLFDNNAHSTVDTKFTVDRLVNGNYKKIKGFWTHEYKVKRHWEKTEHSKTYDLNNLQLLHVDFPAFDEHYNRGEVDLTTIKG